ncbi:Uncharacterized protein APZ42_007973 [Daphnia magna]|uniref:Uncharacterized protein n=1 Tax=Daphnia magna TaxID=35525 RepID=A0A162D195_9CRUS|nr:Uncharacterized protein APZ42_007973 [Daphnia magna]
MANRLISGNNGIFQARFNGTGFSQLSFEASHGTGQKIGEHYPRNRD